MWWMRPETFGGETHGSAVVASTGAASTGARARWARARVRAVVGGSRGARADVRSRARWCYNGTGWIGRSGERGLETVGVVETEIFEGAVVLAPSVAHLDLNV